MLKKLLKISVYASLATIPFYFFRFSFGPLKTNIFEIFVLASAMFCIWAQIRRKQEVRWGPVFPYLFVGTALLSMFFSGDKTQALGIFKGWFFIPVLLYWVIINTFNVKNISKLSIPIFALLLIVSIWAILQKLGVITTLFYQVGNTSFNQYLDGGRVFGPFDSPNFLAMYLVPMFFLSLPILALSKQKILLGTLFVLPFTALYFSGSKGGIVALLVSLAIYFNYRYVNILKVAQRKPIYLSVILISLVAVYFAYISVFFKTSANLTGSNAVRQEIYQYSVGLLKDYPIFGIGIGNFQEKIRELSIGNYSFIEYGLPYALHPHNLMLALWLNLGILGLLLFFANLAVFLKNVFSSDSYLRSVLLAAMSSILIHGLFDTTYFKNDLSAIFWIIMAVSFLILSKTKSHAELVSASGN